jgi:hypothetical protein
VSAQVPAAAVTSLAVALYALHDILVEKGILAEGEVANTLRRFAHDDANLMAHIHALAAHLDERPFRVRPHSGLEVIKGGREG